MKLKNIDIKVWLIYSIVTILFGWVIYLSSYYINNSNLLEFQIFTGMSIMAIGFVGLISFSILGLVKIILNHKNE